MGFPSRFDTTITGVEIAAEGGSWFWAAPFLQVFQLSYNPTRAIVVWPERQELAVGRTEIVLMTEGMRASLDVGLGAEIPLRSATLETGPVTAALAHGTDFAMARGLFALREAGEETAYDVFAEAQGVTLPVHMRPASMGADADQPITLRIDGTATLEGPITIRGPEAPTLRHLDIRDATIRWGELELSASKRVTGDAPDPEADVMVIRFSDFHAILEAAEAVGLVPTEQVAMARAGWSDRVADDGSLEMELPLMFFVPVLIAE